MCAEELTNQVLYLRNVPAGEKDVWLTFEAIGDGELGGDPPVPSASSFNLFIRFWLIIGQNKQQQNKQVSVNNIPMSQF